MNEDDSAYGGSQADANETSTSVPLSTYEAKVSELTMLKAEFARVQQHAIRVEKDAEAQNVRHADRLEDIRQNWENALNEERRKQAAQTEKDCKEQYEAGIDRRVKEAVDKVRDTLVDDTRKECDQLHRQLVDQHVADRLKECRKQVGMAESLGLLSPEAKSLLNVCRDCNTDKNAYIELKAKYDHFENVIRSAPACYKCADTTMLYQTYYNNGQNQYNQLEQEKVKLEKENKKLAKQLESLTSEKNTFSSILTKTHEKATELQQQRDDLIGVESCRNCRTLEVQANNCRERTEQVEKQATQYYTDWQAREASLKQEGTELLEKFNRIEREKADLESSFAALNSECERQQAIHRLNNGYPQHNSGYNNTNGRNGSSFNPGAARHRNGKGFR